MSQEANQEILQSLVTELAKNLKSEKDLSVLSRELVKLTVETALGKLTPYRGKHNSPSPSGGWILYSSNFFSTFNSHAFSDICSSYVYILRPF